jgi:dolichol-phosphate mannosyltransferase
MNILDPTAGFVCYRRETLEKINLDQIKFIGYAFQIEMKYITYRNKFIIKEVPIIFTDRIRGASKLSKGIIGEAIFGVLQMRLKIILGN